MYSFNLLRKFKKAHVSWRLLPCKIRQVMWNQRSTLSPFTKVLCIPTILYLLVVEPIQLTRVSCFHRFYPSFIPFFSASKQLSTWTARTTCGAESCGPSLACAGLASSWTVCHGILGPGDPNVKLEVLELDGYTNSGI